MLATDKRTMKELLPLCLIPGDFPAPPRPALPLPSRHLPLHSPFLSPLFLLSMTWSYWCCRDHRKLGQELELFSIEAETAGGGLVFWHPNGAAIRNILENFWKVSTRFPMLLARQLLVVPIPGAF